MTEYPTLDFGSEVKETFTHIIAIGDKANSMLSRLRADLGDKFEHDMLTIEEGSKYVRFLVAIVDESASFDNLQTSCAYFLSGKTILWIIDIEDRPSIEEWSKAESYLWASQEKQYDNVRNLLDSYHSQMSRYGLICMDFNDWRWSVKGRKILKSYVLRSNEESVLKLLPTWQFEANRGVYICQIGIPTGWWTSKQQMEAVMNATGDVMKKFGDDAYLHWQIFEREDSNGEISFTLLQFTSINKK